MCREKTLFGRGFGKGECSGATVFDLPENTVIVCKINDIGGLFNNCRYLEMQSIARRHGAFFIDHVVSRMDHH